MGMIRDDLLALLETNNPTPTLSYWCEILNFSKTHKNSLSIQDMELICDESERSRAYWNTDRSETITVFRNGIALEQEHINKRLNIKKNDISPNVYQFLEEKVQREKEELITKAKAAAQNIIRNQEPILIPQIPMLV